MLTPKKLEPRHREGARTRTEAITGVWQVVVAQAARLLPRRVVQEQGRSTGDPDLPDRPVGSGSLVVLTQLSVSFAAFLAFGVWIRRKVQGQNSAAHAVVVLK